MIAWRHAELEDIPSLRSFECYSPPAWAPGTPWQVKKQHQSWVRRVESLVRQLQPPVYPQEHMLICGNAGEAAVDGLIYAGQPHLNAQGELLITVYAMARSVRARSRGIGASALERLEGIALEVAEAVPGIQRVYYRGLVHRSNSPCRSLLTDNGWWEGDQTNDPDYSEWWFSIAFED